MGQSYIREGTNVVCTNMTCGTPQLLLRRSTEWTGD